MKAKYYLLADHVDEMFVEYIKYNKDTGVLDVGYTPDEFEAMCIKDYNVATLTCWSLNEKGIFGITTVAINK